jgi:beta-lactamase class A
MYTQPFHRSRRRRSKSRHFWLWGLIAALLLIGAGWLLLHQSPSKLSYFKPVADLTKASPTPTPTPAFVPLDVEARWQAVLANYPTFRVSAELRDVSHGATATIDAKADFRAASTTKLIAASYFLHQVEEGKYSLDQPMGNYTAKFHLQQMINRSNNDSWAAFLTLLGRSNEEAYAHQQGWTSFNVTDNHIAPDDLADLLQKLWQGKLLTKEHTDYLLSLMQNTIDEQWIPPAIPAGATIYHKYGALEDDVHDASLITYQGRTYALVIMTNGNGAYAYTQRAKLFHDLVKAAFSTDPPPTAIPTSSPTP